LVLAVCSTVPNEHSIVRAIVAELRGPGKHAHRASAYFG
jgi:hypothetical protein